MDPSDLDNRFAFHASTGAKGDDHAQIRQACRETSRTIDRICPDSREKSLAVTALEEAMMWANAALARHDTETGARL